MKSISKRFMYEETDIPIEPEQEDLGVDANAD